MNEIRRATLSAACSLLLCLLFFSCKKKGAPVYASLQEETTYVGMETCRSCHADIYESFIQTGMGQSFDRASRKKSSANFSNHAPVYDRYSDLWYYPFWLQDTLYIREYRLQGSDTVYQRTERIDYIIGSGQHTNSHLIERHGYLFQAPLTFYTQSQRWDLAPGFEHGNNSRFSRLIGLECITCHNAFPVFVPGSENKYVHLPSGIDCERCHGPGSQHVKEKQAGKTVDITRQIDYSIVNPSKLPIDLQFDICQRCHIQGNAVLNENKSFLDFRPGMRLSDVMNVFMPVYSGSEDEHIMASHAERLKMSRCYLVTKEKISSGPTTSLKPYEHGLTCITCHNPHVSVKKTRAEEFNAACLKCHSSEKHTHGCTAPVQALEKETFNCIKCHMPASGTTDIPHVRITDHYIRKPMTPGHQDKIKKFTGIAAINNPEAPAWSRGMAFIYYYEKFGFESWALDSALSYFSSDSKKEIEKNLEPLIHIAYLKRNYRQVAIYEGMFKNLLKRFSRTSLDNRHAFTCYRLGYSLEQTGQVKRALAYYRQASQLAPLFADFQLAYASALTTTGDTLAAIQIYESVLREQPYNTRALSNLGFLQLMANGNTQRAEQLYRQALRLDPDYLPACYNLAGLYIYQRRLPEARKILQEILQRFPSEEKARTILYSLSLP
jgi:hypothetical protein